MDPNQTPPGPDQPEQVGPQVPSSQKPMHAQPSTESNTIAVVGLVLAFLFWPAGLVCSIIGLKKAKRLNGKGHGMALAGLIASIAVGIIGLLILPALILVSVPALQRNDRNAQRKTDVSALQAAIKTYSANHNGNIPGNNTELDAALSAVDLGFYGGNIANGLTAADTQTDHITGRGVIAVEQAATITSADFSPTEDEVQVILQAKCNSTSSLALNAAYTAKGANLVTETTNMRDFAVVYGLEGETNVICEDNS